MLRDCENKTMLLLLVATTTNGCTVVSSQMPSLLVPHSCFHSACYLSNFGGFHAIQATKGRSLGGGSIYIYIP